MSNFVVNKHGLDQVTLEFTTTGSSEASINLRDALLDEKLDYVFCVDHLNCPLDSVPITNIINKELFRVERRNVGLGAPAAIAHGLNVAANTALADAVFVYTLNRKFYDVPSFVRDLNNWARGVEQFLTIQGMNDFRTYGGDSNAISALASIVPPLRALAPRTLVAIQGGLGYYDFIRFRLTVDGTLVLELSHDFINNFIIKFGGRLGGEVLGLGSNISAVVRNLITVNPAPAGGLLQGPAQTDYYLAVTNGVMTTAAWLQDTANGANIIQPGGNLSGITVHSEHSLYTVMDQRVKISLSSHLPMLNSIFIKEQKETVDRSILEVFFTNKIQTSVKFDDQGIFTEQQITNKLYAGQYPFVKKTDIGKQWHKLLTVYDLRFFRFHIHITYRTYKSATDEWVFKTTRLPVGDTKYWDFSLRFLSEV